jgi:chromate transporter
VIGALPLWDGARRHPQMQRAMLGVNASVVGLLLAAFYRPVFVGGILSAADFGLAAMAWLLLAVWKLPPWAVVFSCCLATGLGWH